ncbi:hypothetical protein H5410_019871 [Solanum commersonii]|uniref:Uncharacterized protein n=1 Tax=Solanum commersonii TaxID=4109 RepID=A0A9J5ZCH7_SOLCO|nr:hypothetical protein H5410_019871 [Solanum commersonii]
MFHMASDPQTTCKTVSTKQHKGEEETHIKFKQHYRKGQLKMPFLSSFTKLSIFSIQPYTRMQRKDCHGNEFGKLKLLIKWIASAGQ